VRAAAEEEHEDAGRGAGQQATSRRNARTTTHSDSTGVGEQTAVALLLYPRPPPRRRPPHAPYCPAIPQLCPHAHGSLTCEAVAAEVAVGEGGVAGLHASACAHAAGAVRRVGGAAPRGGRPRGGSGARRGHQSSGGGGASGGGGSRRRRLLAAQRRAGASHRGGARAGAGQGFARCSAAAHGCDARVRHRQHGSSPCHSSPSHGRRAVCLLGLPLRRVSWVGCGCPRQQQQQRWGYGRGRWLHLPSPDLAEPEGGARCAAAGWGGEASPVRHGWLPLRDRHRCAASPSLPRQDPVPALRAGHVTDPWPAAQGVLCSCPLFGCWMAHLKYRSGIRIRAADI